MVTDANTRSPNIAEHRRVFARSLQLTVQRLGALGAKVVIVASYSELETDAPTSLARAAQNGDPTPHGPSLESYFVLQKYVFPVIAQLDRLDGVSVIHPHETLCGKISVTWHGMACASISMTTILILPRTDFLNPLSKRH
jgi:hypothetical protein